ncbi:hypothetical protein J5A54_03260 [Prevotella melaninogenica]|uniref:hypothetical protein n=1 Tax=Prevotella melaninogenica TaxID=28132 RepID=UPI001BA51AAD|nr:hypothetical protein [Prevotella melaninogenica]QUB63878.1 hypothetical protein J5A54_03260 [Prevotella melaninogenica]
MLIIFGILQIILFFKLWIMTNDVAAIRRKIAPPIEDVQKPRDLLGMYVRIRSNGKKVRVVARDNGQYKCVDGVNNEPCGTYFYEELEVLG